MEPFFVNGAVFVDGAVFVNGAVFVDGASERLCRMLWAQGWGMQDSRRNIVDAEGHSMPCVLFWTASARNTPLEEENVALG